MTAKRITRSSAGLRSSGFLLMVMLLRAATADAETPWNIRLSSNNDILVNDEVTDDFYTFGFRVDLSLANWTLRFEENAFTDRDGAELRFDENYATLGRLVPGHRLGGWYLWLEAGAAWIGEGVLGQDFQNEMHEVFDSRQVELEYVTFDDTFFHGGIELGRQWKLGRAWSHGPILGGSWTPDFRTNALAGWRAIWRPSDRFKVDVIAGSRYAQSDLELLANRLEETGPAAQVEIDLPWNLVLEWSLNRYGTGREHLALGVSFGPGRSLRRWGNWGDESNATP